MVAIRSCGHGGPAASAREILQAMECGNQNSAAAAEEQAASSEQIYAQAASLSGTATSLNALVWRG